MGDSGKLLLDATIKISSFLVFLFATPAGWTILAALAVLALVVTVASALRRHILLSRAAGVPPGFWGSLLAAARDLLALGGRIALSLPTLAVAVAAALALAGVGQTAARVEEAAASAARIRELKAVLKNLERSVKVADVRVLSTLRGVTTLTIEFHDPGRPADRPPARKEISIPGRDIYFDALVLNFDYSEISEGRRVNIAVPYRVFSDEVSQLEGIPLGAVDEAGIPLIFNRSDDDVYGIAPEIYRERLRELVSLIADDGAARSAGIVRSFYGSAVHRRVSPGDRFEIRIEQTGGLTVRERMPF